MVLRLGREDIAMKYFGIVAERVRIGADSRIGCIGESRRAWKRFLAGGELRRQVAMEGEEINGLFKRLSNVLKDRFEKVPVRPYSDCNMSELVVWRRTIRSR